MFGHVLVPVDGSKESEAILPIAAQIATTLGIELRLVRVIDHGFERQAAEAQLASLARDFAAAASAVIESGNSVRAIATELETNPGGLLAMTTHGRTGLTEEVIGTTALTLVRTLARPVLVYRPPVDHEPVSDRVPIETVVVPVDGGEFSESMIPIAAGFAKAMQARVEFIQVIEALESPAPPDVLDSSYVRSKAIDVRNAVGVPVTFEVLHGDPGRAIPEYIRARPRTILAMSTHARRGIERLVFGGVTNACLRGAGVPILLRYPGEH